MQALKNIPFAFGVLAFAAAAYAQEQPGGFYLNTEAGGVLQQNLNIRGGDKIEFNPGFRFDAGFGWCFAPPLSAEIETGVIYNTVHRIGGQPVSSFGGSADLYQVPLLANLIFTVPLKCPLKPYIGFGLGGVATVVDLKSPLGDVNDSDFTFGYQGLAGLKYDLGKHVELGVAYKFLGTTDHHWAEQGVTLDTKPTMSHSILATLTWKF